MSGVKRPGGGEGPDGKRAYAGPSADFMDAEPELPEEYEDPDDDDVFLNDVMDQKVSARIDRSSVPSFFSNRGVAGFQPSRATHHPSPDRIPDGVLPARPPPRGVHRSTSRTTRRGSTGSASPRRPSTPPRTTSASSSSTSTTSSASRTPCWAPTARLRATARGSESSA